MQDGEEVKARVFQGRAFQIIAELMNTLNHEAGGEIAANLHRLYAFMLYHLSEGNLRRDPQRFDEVARLLTVLQDAFTQAFAVISHPATSASYKMTAMAV
jgi:flagellar protein FliS